MLRMFYLAVLYSSSHIALSRKCLERTMRVALDLVTASVMLSVMLLPTWKCSWCSRMARPWDLDFT